MEPQQPIPSSPVQSQPQTPMKAPHSLRTKLLIIFLGVLVIVGFVMYAYQKDRVDNSQKTEPTPISLPVVEETTEWKTYRNEEYGFEFEYPKNLYLFDSTDCSHGGLYAVSVGTKEENNFCDAEITMLVTSKTSTNDCFPQSLQVLSRDKLTVGNQPAEQIIIENPRSTNRNETVTGFGYKNSCFTITNREQLIPESNYNQILSTFRFVEEEDVDDSTMQIYSDPVGGFSIQYRKSEGITSKEEGSGVSFGGRFRVYIVYDYAGEPIKDWFDANHDLLTYDVSYETYQVDGVNALIVKADDLGSMGATYVAIPKGDKIFIIHKQSGQENLDEIKEIVSTFKFLK